jgi:predicted RNase H-like HicB family nuclease
MHEAIELHIQGLKEDHQPIPKSHAIAEYIAVTG